jgi:HK97 family phage prohead protease
MTETMISRWIAVDDMEIHRVNRKAREVTAYATFFSQPAEIHDKHGHYFEEINRAAFNRTISHGIGRVQVYYNHGYDLTGRPNVLGAVPIATPVDIRPDGRGLLTISRYNDGEVADAVLAAWEGGQIRGQSFNGRVHQDREIGQREGIPHIERMELGLKEYGPTPSPAYDGDGLVMIRTKDDLAELVRSMIQDIAVGTPQASPTASDTSAPGTSGHSAEDQDPAVGHSSRTRQLAQLKLKAARITKTGVRHAPSPPVG